MVVKGRTVTELLSLFRGQQAAMDCTPVGLLSVWDEFRDRRGKGGRIGYQQMANATLCEVETTGSIAPASDIRNALKEDHLLPAEATLVGESNGSSSLGVLEEVLAASRKSFPIVTVGPKWWTDPANPLEVRGPPGETAHVVVVVDMSTHSIEVYDPWVRTHHGPDEESIFNVPRVRFNNHWEDTVPLREALWFEALPEQQRIA